MIDLTNESLATLANQGFVVPSYDRTTMGTGVVHFGPGAFHRVHQAWYFDQALRTDRRWGICEVALQTAGVRDALAPQDGLYTLAVLDAVRNLSIVGSIKELLVAKESPATVITRLSDPNVRLITSTVTEKGYCLRSDGSLDVEHADIIHDLAHPNAPRSLIGYLVAGLRVRRAQHVTAPTIVSCDNLTDNGKRLKRGVLDYCERQDADLAAWVAAEVAFPSSMVDSITPATDDALRDLIARELCVRDRWPVQRESFTQWVIEDDLRGTQPEWAAIGVTITDDVGGFERAKLRLLNGAHSTLAYVGSLCGYETVAEAMNDATLGHFVGTMMERDIASTLIAPRGLDIPAYIAAILRRFRNPTIRHLLAQIAWDGSQKLPFRLLGTITDQLESGHSIDRLVMPIAAWMHFIRRKALRGELATDPLAKELLAIGAKTSGDAHDVNAFLSLKQVFPTRLVDNPAFVRTLRRIYERLSRVTSPAELADALKI